MATQMENARKLLSDVRYELFSKPNVVATGLGYKTTKGKQTGDLALICSVETKKAKQSLSSNELIPAMIQNIPTDVFPTGIIHAFQDPTGRFRPAPGGVSIGHYLITAGTFGCIVKKNGVKFILSNNHVLANSNEGNVWVTLQIHQNVVAIASMKELAGVILVNRREPEQETIEKAEEEGIVIMVSELPAYELAGRLYELGISRMG